METRLLDPTGEKQHRHERKSQRPPSNLPSVLLLTLAFFLLFASYNTLQGYVATTLAGNLGFQSLTALYIAFLISLPVAPALCDLMNDKFAMLLGASCYVVFTASLTTGNTICILAASLVIGFGASILWVGQGSAITSWTDDAHRGVYSGIFWCGTQASMIAGPLLSSAILAGDEAASSNQRDLHMYVVFVVIGVLAVLVLAVLWCHRCAIERRVRRLAIEGDTSNTDENAPQNDRGEDSRGEDSREEDSRKPKKALANGKTCSHCCSTFVHRVFDPLRRACQLLRHRDVLLLIAPCVFSGTQSSFSTGEFLKGVGLLPCNAHADNHTACVAAGCQWTNSTGVQNPCAKVPYS